MMAETAQEKEKEEMQHELHGFMQRLADFAEYLNASGYAVTEEDISRAVTLSQSEDANLADTEQAKRIFRVIFCKSKEQYTAFPQYFSGFIRRARDMSAAEEEKKKLEKHREEAAKQYDAYQKKKEEYQEEYERLRQEEEAEMEKAIKGCAVQPLLSTKAISRFRQHASFSSSLLKDLAAGRQMLGPVSARQKKEAEEELLQEGKEAAVEGDVKAAKEAAKLLQDLLSYCSKIADLDRYRQQYAAKQAKEITTQRLQAEQRMKNVETDRKRLETVQKELDKKIEELNQKTRVLPPVTILVRKEGSAHHREQFLPYGNAVQCSGEGLPGWSEKDFRHLTADEKRAMQQYLRENVLKFRTRLTRHIDEMDHQHIDIGSTIRSACRTGGIPMVLHYRKPAVGKADLMLVLDISGSCRDASQMMLTFMYLMQEAFPHGVRAFAFVDALYDISKLMNTQDPDSAAKTVLDTIPTKGVYSDYSRPIITLKEQYGSKVTKDTILIWIGDARNNKNDPAIHEMKYLCRKAKRAYWLNTETRDKWDTGDSAAGIYAEYARMFEAVNPGEIIRFVSEGVR